VNAVVIGKEGAGLVRVGKKPGDRSMQLLHAGTVFSHHRDIWQTLHEWPDDGVSRYVDM
jgi:hypothetical protein